MTKYLRQIAPLAIAALLMLGGLTVSTTAQSTAAKQGGSPAASNTLANQIDITSASKDQ